MPIDINVPDLTELKPRITVFGVGGGGCNAVNNMINSKLSGVEFVVANTDAQALAKSPCERKIQMGINSTKGLGAGSQPEVGAQAAEEAINEIEDHLAGSNMVFITAGMGGGTGTGAAPVIARKAREMGILTVGVVTKPFNFEGRRRMAIAERGIENLAQHVDTLIVIPNQNLFRVANEATSFTAAFAMADQVLYSGVASITELMTKEGLINLDFADVRAVMSDMGKAMMGTGEASGDNRAEEAALAAIANPLLDIESMAGARGVLISISGGPDLGLYEVDQAASRIREEVDPEANIIVGATIEDELEGTMRVSVVATGLSDQGQRSTEAPRQGESMASVAPPPPGLATPVSPGLGGAGLAGTPTPDPVSAPQTTTPATPVSGKEAGGATDMELPLDMPEAVPTGSAGIGGAKAPGQPVGGPSAGNPEVTAKGAPVEPSPMPHTPAPKAPPLHEGVQNGGVRAADSEPGMTPSTPTPPPQTGPRIPDVDEFPPHIRNLVQEKQQQISSVASRGGRRENLFDRVKVLFGKGHEAPQADSAPKSSAAAEPQQKAASSGMDAPQPVEEDDPYSIPAFLRRR